MKLILLSNSISKANQMKREWCKFQVLTLEPKGVVLSLIIYLITRSCAYFYDYFQLKTKTLSYNVIYLKKLRSEVPLDKLEPISKFTFSPKSK